MESQTMDATMKKEMRKCSRLKCEENHEKWKNSTFISNIKEELQDEAESDSEEYISYSEHFRSCGNIPKSETTSENHGGDLQEDPEEVGAEFCVVDIKTGSIDDETMENSCHNRYKEENEDNCELEQHLNSINSFEIVCKTENEPKYGIKSEPVQKTVNFIEKATETAQIDSIKEYSTLGEIENVEFNDSVAFIKTDIALEDIELEDTERFVEKTNNLASKTDLLRKDSKAKKPGKLVIIDPGSVTSIEAKTSGVEAKTDLERQDFEVENPEKWEKSLIIGPEAVHESNQENHLICNYCGGSWHTKSELKNHIFSCHPSFFTSKNKADDVHSDESVKKFSCTVCHKCFSESRDLARHMRIHTGDKPFKCKLCEFRTAWKSYLSIHIRIHTGEKPNKCHVCNYQTSNPSHLRTHILQHTGEKKYKCQMCQYSSVASSSLKAHMKTHEMRYKCDFCKFQSCSRMNMKSHMCNHTGNKPYKCKQCQYSTTIMSDLKKHERTHTGEKPFKCTECDYKTSNSSALRTHLLMHAGVKPFKCNICQFCTTYSSALRTHILRHTGEKPFKCKVCDYSTAVKSDLGVHAKRHEVLKQSKSRKK